MRSWLVVTPEYPPAVGGVSDYVAQLGAGLALAGDAVEVFAPAPADAGVAGSHATVHALPSGFDAAAWRRILRAAHTAQDAVTLLQYTPLSFARPRSLEHLLTWPGRLWIMVHEAAYPFEAGQAFRHRALALGTHLAVRALVARAERVFVSTPACEGGFQKLLPSRVAATWLPIPSNLRAAPEGESRTTVLAACGLDPDQPVLGHFSAFGARVAGLLEGALREVLVRDPSVQVLLVGQGSHEFLERFSAPSGAAKARVRALGRVSSERAASAVLAMDVLVFPYPDGVSSRRTTVMSALSLGRAIVTTDGPNTEAVWHHERCVELCSLEAAELAGRALALLTDRERRRALGERAERVYTERFALERTLETLRGLRSGPC